jgi:hypothetical protein
VISVERALTASMMAPNNIDRPTLMMLEYAIARSAGLNSSLAPLAFRMSLKINALTSKKTRSMTGMKA